MRRSLVAVGLAAALVLSACGSDDDGTSAPSTAAPTSAAATSATATTAAATTAASAETTVATGFPVTVTGDNGDVTLDAAPEAIVSLSPTATEMLFAIGAGPQVVGVSSFDQFPPEVGNLPRLGALLDPDTERILSLRPTLVVIYGSQTELQAQFTRFCPLAKLLEAAGCERGTLFR